MQTAEAQTCIQPSTDLADLAAPFQVSRPTIGTYVELLKRRFLLERPGADLASGTWHSKYGGLLDVSVVPIVQARKKLIIDVAGTWDYVT